MGWETTRYMDETWKNGIIVGQWHDLNTKMISNHSIFCPKKEETRKPRMIPNWNLQDKYPPSTWPFNPFDPSIHGLLHLAPVAATEWHISRWFWRPGTSTSSHRWSQWHRRGSHHIRPWRRWWDVWGASSRSRNGKLTVNVSYMS